jgi:methylphosphotriester-DNA--protein-cysteine methyltransferase
MPVSADPASRDWARYWRADGVPVEAMHAHFTSHVYHRHSHESYSFGVTGSAGSDQRIAARVRELIHGRYDADLAADDLAAAAEVGFADQAHLTRWFRRYYGVTPGAYRAAVQPRAGMRR